MEAKPATKVKESADASKSKQVASKVQVQDDVRLEVAQEVVESLQQVLRSNNTADLSNVAAIIDQLKSARTVTYLTEIANLVKGDPELV